MATGSPPGEWFRTAAWDGAAQEDFERRLRRARADGRPQYLRLKALALAEAGRRADARALLLRLLWAYPDAFDAPSALESLGDLSAEDGRPEEAVGWYRRLLRERPRLDTTTGTALISLAGALVDLGRYTEAVEALGAVDDAALTMNGAVFRYWATSAEAAAGIPDAEAAGEAARRALEVLDAPDQFSRHPGVGRASADRALKRRLRQLADGG